MVTKDWNEHVGQAEDVARRPGFQDLRDRIIERAAASLTDEAIDLGAGTGLLTLTLAPSVKRLWALDISPAMGEYVRAKAASAGLSNVEPILASADSIPLVDESVDIVVSNYCFHHLSDHGKERMLSETLRVLRPGGRLVFGDMMFRPALSDPRDRRVVASKVRAILRKGPSGVARLAKNAARLATARWERPVRPDWWVAALLEAGFTDIEVQPLAHEGGIASARKPR